MKRAFYFLLTLLVIVSCKDDVTNPNEVPIIIPNTIYLNHPEVWKLSSTPMEFEESTLVDDLGYGFNRAKISWNIIDSDIFYGQNNPLRPPNITNGELSNHNVRYVLQTEVFPDKDIPSGVPTLLTTFNLNYFPDERGQNNFETNPTEHSSGMNIHGKLNNPDTRWGGIMASIPGRNYGVHYIDFWLMDPLVNDEYISGELIINVGQISEDILHDNKHSCEAGLNQTWFENDTTKWGIVQPDGMWVSDSVFSGAEQDYGLDGLKKSHERTFFDEYLNNIQAICNAESYQEIFNDPSGDDYHPYTGDDYDNDMQYHSIVERYKKYNGLEGNTQQSVLFPGISWYQRNSFKLDTEDLNGDMNLNTQNAYFEYKININSAELTEGSNYIDESVLSYVQLANGNNGSVTWYHFKIPLEDYTGQYGNISAGSNLETIRLYLTNFDQPIVLRFATFELTEE